MNGRSPGPADAVGRHLALAALAFALPLCVLLPVRFLLGEQGSLSLEIFLVGTGLELLLLAMLALVRERAGWAARSFHFYDFLVRLLVGLPFTIYLTVAAPYAVIGLLRFFPAWSYFLEPRRYRFALQYFLFFVCGAMLFAWLKDYPYPGRVQAITIAVVALLGVLVLIREAMARRRTLLATQKERDLGRLRRRLAHTEAREEASLRAFMPDYQSRLFREDRPLRPLRTSSLLLQFRFPDLERSLEDFARSVDAPSVEKGLSAFAAEWDRFIGSLLAEARERSYQIARHGEDLYCIRLSPEDEAEVQAETLRMVFWAQAVLRSAEHMRRRFHARGRQGWRVQAGLVRGETTGMPQSGGSPAWMLLGAERRRLSDFLQEAPDGEEAVWVQPELVMSIHSFFEGGSGRFFRDWFAPSYLATEFARDDSGVEPAEDFFERLKYSRD